MWASQILGRRHSGVLPAIGEKNADVSPPFPLVRRRPVLPTNNGAFVVDENGGLIYRGKGMVKN